MANLTTALTIVLSVTMVFVMMGLIRTDILKVESAGLISCNGTMLAKLGDCSGSFILNTVNNSMLPGTNLNPVNPTGLTGEEGIFAAIGKWFADVTGISYLYNIISAPTSFLKGIGLSSVYADLIASIWYGVTLFLIVSWLKGQDI
jgi:hypothetical protein